MYCVFYFKKRNEMWDLTLFKTPNTLFGQGTKESPKSSHGL